MGDFDPKDSDKDLIYNFLGSARNTLDELLHNNDILLKEFKNNNNILHMMISGWKEIEHSIGTTCSYLSNNFNKITEPLRVNGLTGVQLRFKLSVYYELLKSYLKERTYRWLKRLLASMNAIINSLSKVLPDLESFCEFKDIYEQMLSKTA